MATAPDGLNARGLSQDALVEAVRRVVARVGGETAGAGLEVESFRDQSSVRLPPEHAAAVLAALRDDADTRFDMLMDVTCVHWPRRGAPLGAFDVVYHLVSLAKGHRIRLKVACPDPAVGVASVTGTWKGANLMEREAYDMFGVRFQGHPDLRRVLMSDDYDGWPMRKEFPYRGH